ncbi:MAG: 4Fe-4S dicluster domain-containing protein [Desulfurivibrio sp.]
MKQNRRNFLKKAGLVTVAGMTLPLSALKMLTPSEAVALTTGDKAKRWGFVVDTTKCVGCGLCVKACKLENNTPYESNVARTWVERYVQRKSGRVTIDSPGQARGGFITNTPLGKPIADEEISKGYFVPKLCNHCDKPSCVSVCPAGATYKTSDGVVLVDRSWCIGCGFCITNCPYGARYFHPVWEVIDKCTFCYHRITKGMNSACVDACAFGARKIGMLNDPDSEVQQIILRERVAVLKPESHNYPQVFYIGLDHLVK